MLGIHFMWKMLVDHVFFGLPNHQKSSPSSSLFFAITEEIYLIKCLSQIYLRRQQVIKA